MEDYEEMSFVNRVLFHEEELLKLHETGRAFRSDNTKNKSWQKVYHTKGRKGRGGLIQILTPRTIAVLCGLNNLHNFDKDLYPDDLSVVFDGLVMFEITG